MEVKSKNGKIYVLNDGFIGVGHSLEQAKYNHDLKIQRFMKWKAEFKEKRNFLKKLEVKYGSIRAGK